MRIEILYFNRKVGIITWFNLAISLLFEIYFSSFEFKGEWSRHCGIRFGNKTYEKRWG